MPIPKANSAYRKTDGCKLTSESYRQQACLKNINLLQAAGSAVRQLPEEVSDRLSAAIKQEVKGI